MSVNSNKGTSANATRTMRAVSGELLGIYDPLESDGWFQFNFDQRK